MPIQPPSDLKQNKSRLTPNLADYIFSESHSANSPIAKSWDSGVDGNAINYGDAHPDITKFPAHVLVYVSTERVTKEGIKVVDFYYAAIGVDQDDYNWVYSGYSGSQYKQFTRKYLIKRAALTAEVVIPLNTADAVASDYVLYDTKLVTTGSKELDSIYVMRQSTYILPGILNGITYDAKLKENYAYEETFVFGDYNEATNNGGLSLVAPLLIQATPINASWTRLVTRRKGDANDYTSRSYTTYINYSWPAVLERLTIPAITTKADIEPEEMFLFQDAIVKNPYSGPCRALVLEELFDDVDWLSAPAPAATDEPMFPEATTARGVFSSLNIRATLHIAFTYTETRGTSSPWANGTTTWTYPATNYTEWPDDLIISSTVSPTAKGWMRKTVTVYKPGT